MGWGDRVRGAVLTVGDGRGFVIKTEPRVVVTAAHCLPELPPAHPGRYLQEKTYPILGVVTQKADVWAKCRFADPIADIAVLGEPDSQALGDEWEAFESLVGDAKALGVAAPLEEGTARLLGLDLKWHEAEYSHKSGNLWLRGATDGILAGMSGSPIINHEGYAIGVISTSHGQEGDDHTEGGPQASLRHCLPGWLLEELGF